MKKEKFVVRWLRISYVHKRRACSIYDGFTFHNSLIIFTCFTFLKSDFALLINSSYVQETG